MIAFRKAHPSLGRPQLLARGCPLVRRRAGRRSVVRFAQPCVLLARGVARRLRPLRHDQRVPRAARLRDPGEPSGRLASCDRHGTRQPLRHRGTRGGGRGGLPALPGTATLGRRPRGRRRLCVTTRSTRTRSRCSSACRWSPTCTTRSGQRGPTPGRSCIHRPLFRRARRTPNPHPHRAQGASED